MPNYTNNLELEKPLQSENYNIDIFNSNADKIDTAIQSLNNKYSELYLEVNGQRLRGINIANAIIDKLEG
jgi:hypothetical protein